MIWNHAPWRDQKRSISISVSKRPKNQVIFVFLINHFFDKKIRENKNICFSREICFLLYLEMVLRFRLIFLNLKSERNLNLVEETSDSLWLVNERKIGKIFTHLFFLHSVVSKLSQKKVFWYYQTFWARVRKFWRKKSFQVLSMMPVRGASSFFR